VCLGTLPARWGATESFPKLSTLDLTLTPLSGSLPASWAQNGSLPSLESLVLEETQLSGNLPTEWGSQTAFHRLAYLDVGNYQTVSSITGDMLQLMIRTHCNMVTSLPSVMLSHANTTHYALRGSKLCHSSLTASVQASSNGYTIQSHPVGTHKCMW
jgi:hypothetical protein